MQLKGIALAPVSLNASERTIRDLLLQVASRKPSTLILILPDGQAFIDAISVDFMTRIETEETEYSCNMGILDDINLVFLREKLPSVFLNEETAKQYGVKAVLPDYAQRFLGLADKVMPEYKIACLTGAPLPKEELLECGRSVREAVEMSGDSAVMVVFTNLDYPDSREYENLITESLKLGDYMPILNYEPTIREESGYNSLLIGIGATEKLRTVSALMGKEKSECAFLSFAVESLENNKSEEKATADFLAPSIIEAYIATQQKRRKELIEAESDILKMVRATVSLWVKERKKLNFETYSQTAIEDPEILDRLKKQRTGVFISVFKDGKPRGTMGTVNPVTENIAEEIIRNSIEAAMYDPQYIPVQIEELDDLNFTVTVMDPPERVDELDELDPEKYGVIVEQGLKRGVVLPNTGGIKTGEEQINLAKERAGIDESVDNWDPVLISRFSAEVFS